MGARELCVKEAHQLDPLSIVKLDPPGVQQPAKLTREPPESCNQK